MLILIDNGHSLDTPGKRSPDGKFLEATYTREIARKVVADLIERVRKNPLAVAVKINDLTDNMDIRRLPYLSDKDVKRLKKYLKAYKKLIGEPVYSIYAARQENPNAYDPWTEEADAQLRQMWEDGTSVAEIAQHFGRKQSAVIVRMKKLGI